MDEDAKRLGDNFLTLAEFLEKKATGLPRCPGSAARHSCTATATTRHVMTLTHEQSVLKKMGLDYEMLDSGCCGMAGSFGFEAEPLRRLGGRRRARAAARRPRRPRTIR